jgi:hypothetical protein
MAMNWLARWQKWKLAESSAKPRMAGTIYH